MRSGACLYRELQTTAASIEIKLKIFFSGSTNNSFRKHDAILQTIPITVNIVALICERNVMPVKLRIVPATQLKYNAV